MKRTKLLSLLLFATTLLSSEIIFAQDTLTIGTGTSSSSTRGPLQRSDTNSSSVYSRNVLLYTATELAAGGITSGSSINELRWEKGNSNVIIGAGNANLKLYMRNSIATTIDTTDWAAYIPGSTQVLDSNFNTTNNFPSTSGWMAFPLDNSFIYTGGSLEIAIDWDGSQVSTPQFDGNGSVTWRWSATSGNALAQRVSGSAAPNDLTKVKAERANTQIVYSNSTVTCSSPTGLTASSTSSGANLSWTASAGAIGYYWRVVPAGASSTSTAIDSGGTITTTAASTALSALTSYDLYVQSICSITDSSLSAGPANFLTKPAATDTVTIGVGTSSSSTRGPLQRSDTNSSTVFSRWHQVYTAAELTTAGLVNGTVITSLNWELASSNVIIGNGNANIKIYIKNSSATAAVSDTWVNLTSGSSLVHNVDYNTTNNFPGASGWMPFDFSNTFTYTGGAIEVSVDWDNSQLSTPAFSGDGALKWRWESTTPDDLVAKKTGSSSAPSTLSDLEDERANIQIVYASTSTVGINELDKVTSLEILPNPTNGIANLNLELTERAVVGVSVYAIDGKLIESLTQQNVSQLNKSIDLSAYEDGLYFIRVSIDNQETVKKVILVK